MAVDPQNPRDVGWDLLFQLKQGVRYFVELGAALGFQVGPAGIEKYLGLQHKSVADNTHVRPVAEDLTKLAKEIRTIALELIDPIGQLEIEALAELSDAALRFFVFLLICVEGLFKGGKLATQRRNLLVEHLDLRKRAGGNFLFAFQLAGEF